MSIGGAMRVGSSLNDGDGAGRAVTSFPWRSAVNSSSSTWRVGSSENGGGTARRGCGGGCVRGCERGIGGGAVRERGGGGCAGIGGGAWLGFCLRSRRLFACA